MTTDNFCFYLQNRLIPTGQTGDQWYIDTSPFSIPWAGHTRAEHLKSSYNTFGFKYTSQTLQLVIYEITAENIFLTSRLHQWGLHNKTFYGCNQLHIVIR
jgi:hypothetical protein